jgi:hypothetical protein
VARIDSVIHNFAHHLTSGLSGFIVAAYEVSDRTGYPLISLVLEPAGALPEPLQKGEFPAKVDALRDKFFEILEKESGMPRDQIDSLTVHLDFAPDPELVEKRRRRLSASRVYYGYDPVYVCTVNVRLSSGVERTVTLR